VVFLEQLYTSLAISVLDPGITAIGFANWGWTILST
jgi:hypothetical protein